MKSLSIQEAENIINLHKSDSDPQYQKFKQWVLKNYKFSNSEIIAMVLSNYSEQKNNAKFIDMIYSMGVKITKVDGSRSHKIISYNNECYEFGDLSLGLPKELLIKGDCHKCCYNAAVNLSITKDAYICTSATSTIDNKTNYSLSKLLHSYLLVGETVLDLSDQISMNVKDYEKLFNITNYSKVSLENIQDDVKNNTIKKLSQAGCSLIKYLLARQEVINNLQTIRE